MTKATTTGYRIIDRKCFGLLPDAYGWSCHLKFLAEYSNKAERVSNYSLRALIDPHHLVNEWLDHDVYVSTAYAGLLSIALISDKKQLASDLTSREMWN